MREGLFSSFGQREGGEFGLFLFFHHVFSVVNLPFEVVEVEVQFAKIVHIVVVLCTEGEIFYGFKQEIRVTGYLAR